jgi:hypothetical protein
MDYFRQPLIGTDCCLAYPSFSNKKKPTEDDHWLMINADSHAEEPAPAWDFCKRRSRAQALSNRAAESADSHQRVLLDQRPMKTLKSFLMSTTGRSEAAGRLNHLNF